MEKVESNKRGLVTSTPNRLPLYSVGAVSEPKGPPYPIVSSTTLGQGVRDVLVTGTTGPLHP